MAMGIYATRVLPRIMNTAGGMKALEPLRRRVCDGLEGEVVEIGFGSGLNVPFYPATVTRVAAIEPADLGWKLADKRLRATSVTVERSGLDGQSLPFPDDTFDGALSTWTLCTIPDATAALGELRRVLKPGGRFHFLEHGRAPDEPVRRWQGRLEPVQKKLFGGCHFTRPIVDLLTTAGFTIRELDVFYEKGAPEVRRCRLPRHCGVPLTRAVTQRKTPPRRWGLSVLQNLRRGQIRPGGRSQPAGPWGPA
jgi:SAM-dependent methyltransferase